MSDYGKIFATFWTRGSGKKLRGDPIAQVLASYLMTCGQANNLTGIYYIAIPTIAHEVGAAVEEIRTTLERLSDVGIAHYDFEEEMVWVPNMARYQIGPTLAKDDNRRKALLKALEAVSAHPFAWDFVDLYRVSYSLDWQPPPSTPRGQSRFVAHESEAPSKPLQTPSQAPSKRPRVSGSPFEASSGGSSHDEEATFDASKIASDEKAELPRDSNEIGHQEEAPSKPLPSPSEAISGSGSGSESGSGTDPSQKKSRASPKPPKPKPNAPDGYAAVVDFWFVEFEKVRGKPPSFGARDGKAVKILLEALKTPEEVCGVIRNALADPWWTPNRASLPDLANNPNRFIGKQNSTEDFAIRCPSKARVSSVQRSPGWKPPESCDPTLWDTPANGEF